MEKFYQYLNKFLFHNLKIFKNLSFKNYFILNLLSIDLKIFLIINLFEKNYPKIYFIHFKLTPLKIK